MSRENAAISKAEAHVLRTSRDCFTTDGKESSANWLPVARPGMHVLACGGIARCRMISASVTPHTYEPQETSAVPDAALRAQRYPITPEPNDCE
jgi:hypothetical protein